MGKKKMKKDWYMILVRLDPVKDKALIHAWKALLAMCGSVPKAFKTLLRDYLRDK